MHELGSIDVMHMNQTLGQSRHVVSMLHKQIAGSRSALLAKHCAMRFACSAEQVHDHANVPAAHPFRLLSVEDGSGLNTCETDRKPVDE